MEKIEEIKVKLEEASRLMYESYRALDVTCTGYQKLSRADLFTLLEMLPDGIHKATLREFYSSRYGGINESMSNEDRS